MVRDREERTGEGDGDQQGLAGGGGPRAGGEDADRDRSRGPGIEGARPAGPVAAGPSRAPLVGRVLVLLVAVLFAIFALANSQPVDFSWVFGETQVQRDAAGEVSSGGVPLIVLLLVAFIVGATLGGWWTWQAGRGRRRRHDERMEGS